MLKINWKKNINFGIWILIFGILVHTRFVNLGWALPYPMHPDERNMANAVQQLHCEVSSFKFQVSDCFNPHFFAYGQFPLYLSYIGIQLYHFLTCIFGQSINFIEATMALRTLSAISSIITAFILYKILSLFISKKDFTFHVLCFVLLSFSPALIQFSHFGTTESLLILLYSTLVYISLLYLRNKLFATRYLFLTSLISGIALATKVSSLFFIIVPLFGFLYQHRKRKKRLIINTCLFFTSMLLFFVIFSPHNILSINEFLGSMQYESDVALGRISVFYTRQFSQSIPVLFQFTKIYPYALGIPISLFAILGFFFLPWRNIELNIMRIAFLAIFLPSAFMFAKWTRFIAPTFPLLIILAILFLSKIKFPRLLFPALCFISVIPGIAYLSIYQSPDVRFQASSWIFKHIPDRSYILSETANVVDLPLENTNFVVISFNYYDVDSEPSLQSELYYHIRQAQYIFVPSRRIFKNNIKYYPLLDQYYHNLFSGKLGFIKVA